MRPLFTVHAGEFLVGQHIESKRKNVWIPTKDIGADLLVTNSANTKAATLQVKFSRDFLPIMKDDPSILNSLRSCTWFTLDRKKLARSNVTLWVFVVPSFDKHSFDYVVIKPSELKKKLEALRDYQTYIWVTKQNRAWLTRGLSKKDLQQIAAGTFKDKVRDLTRYLNDWSLIENL